MKTMNHTAAWAILIERKAERKESRVAFIAALLMAKSRAAGEVGLLIGSLTPHQAMIYAVELVRLATSIHHLCEAACNYQLSQMQETRLENLRNRFQRLADALGFDARTGGDPRGACAYLIDPDDRRGDSFAGEGFAVYA